MSFVLGPALERAGMAGVDGGQLGDPALPMMRPSVMDPTWLQDGRLLYPDAWGTPAEREIDPVNALHDFVRIEDENDVLRFARKYGPLLLCGDGHYYRSNHYGHSVPCRPAFAFTGPDDIGGEPIELGWLRRVNMLRGSLELAAAIFSDKKQFPIEFVRERQQRLEEACRILGPQSFERIARFDFQSAALTSDVLYARFKVMNSVNDWLEASRVAPFLDWFGDRPGFTFRVDTFGALALQFLTAVTKGFGLAVCSGCGHPYTAGRKPAASKRSFCKKCRAEGVPNRLAQRDHAARGRKSEEARI